MFEERERKKLNTLVNMIPRRETTKGRVNILVNSNFMYF